MDLNLCVWHRNSNHITYQNVPSLCVSAAVSACVCMCVHTVVHSLYRGRRLLPPPADPPKPSQALAQIPGFRHHMTDVCSWTFDIHLL